MEQLQSSLEGFWLSPQQKRVWLLGRSGLAPVGQGVVLAEGALDPCRLEAALARVAERHEILRTTFKTVSGMAFPLQVVEDGTELALRVVDWSAGAPEVTEDEAFEAILREEREAGFDFEEGPVVRFCRIALGEHRHALVITLPSLCGDAASLENLVGEIGRAYLAEGGVPSLQEQEEPVQYIQFSEWQNEILSVDSEEGEPGRRYWRSYPEISGPSPSLPLEREAEGEPRFPRTLRLSPNPDLEATLSAWAAARGVTESAVLLAAWWGTLCRLTGGDELRISVQCPGRAYEEMLGALGLYERWPAIGRGLRSGFLFSEVVDAFSRELGEALEWQEFYGPEVDTAGDGGFGFEYTTRRGESFQAGPVRFSLTRLDACAERFKLRLSAARGPRGLGLGLCFDPGLYEVTVALRLADSFLALLAAGLAAPETPVQALEVLGGTELGLLALWNRTSCPRPAEERLHELFVEQARSTPGALAVLADDARLTFAELDRRSNRIAWFLVGLGIRPDDRVALCLERSAAAIATLLGTLKAGGAYVPVDPLQPGERLATMLGDAGVRVVLSQSRLASRVPPGPWRTVLLDVESDVLERQPETAPEVDVTAEHLAYVIYTSGSTGRPKGTLVQHRSVANLVVALESAIYRRLGEGPRRVSVNAPLYFDASVKQWIRLLRGDALAIVAEELRTDAPALLDWLRREQVDVLDCTPSLLRLLLGAGLQAADGAPQTLLIGGEAIDAALWETLAADPRRRSFNLYGPTECTVDAAIDEIAAGWTPTLGRAIANVELYVLDAALYRQALGSPGELCVGGEGLARGYLGRPDLTAEKFVPDPYGGRPGGRLYRTGDRARFLPDGRIEFLGRLDNQVKLRGFRIELGEIEAALASHPGVSEAVALLREDQPGQLRLVAYAVERDRDSSPSPEELREHLQHRLPDYMVPAVCVVLGEMPLTRNGKADRRALPAPEEVILEQARERLAPRTPVEEILVAIFAEVLGAGCPGVDESFFELGGHSLLATQLIARVRESFRIDLPLRVLFEEPTAEALGRRIEAVLAAGEALAAPPLRPVPRDSDLPLSFAQQRLWFVWQLDPDSPAYNNPKALRIRGELDATAVARTLCEIVRRHEVLRTTFPAVNGEPSQRINPAATLPLPLVDLTGLPAAGRESLAHRLFPAEARRPFDLAREVPVRACLLRLDGEDHVLLLTFHHIACDAWSLAILEREVGALYEAFAAGRPSPLPELPVQYADFAGWQRGWLQGEVLERQLCFWRDQLAGAPPLLDLPLDHPRPPVASARGGKVRFGLPAGLSRELVRLSQRRASTLFMTLLAGFQALLARHCGQEDVTVGTPIAGRRHLETEGLIGFFVNTLVLRGRMEGDPTFEDLLGRARETALQAYAHQDLPFERLVDEFAPRRDLASTPLFQTMLVLQNVGREGVRATGLELSSLGADPGVAKFDLTLSLAEGEDGLAGSLEYRAELFDPATVARFGERLATLLEGAVAEPKTRLSDLPLLALAERHHLLYEWNDAAAAMPGEETLHGLVEAQVARTPDAVAVVYEGESLTYRELDRRAAALARRLRAQGVGPEIRIGICAERSLELVIGLLGILKAGGAYVPLDPGYPDARLALVAEDAGFPVLLTQAHLRERLEALIGTETCLLDLVVSAAVDPTAKEARMDSGAGPDHAAYVIFTSGSTGRPKGAVNTHRGIANRLLWMQRAYGLTAADRVLQKTPFSFDVSVWEFFWPLAIGARLVMARPGGHQDPDYLARAIAGEGITCLHFVPSMLRVFLEEADLERCAGLRLVMASGEALPADLAARFHERLGEPCGAELHNLYGPTEAAVDVTWHACRSGEARVPIGRPVANTRIHLLDPAGGLVPVGIVGELHIGGVQVGRGYLGRPDLTAERFVPNPFGPPGGRLYRTGDLARHLPDGEVEYLGRIDYQVKVRGFRIELAEIEAVLAQHPAVHEAVVTARDGGLLVAYVVPAGEEPVDPAALREHLVSELPEYMVPSAWVALDDVPRLPNGKLDRRALPAPGRIETPAGSALAPRTPLEEIVSGLFAEVLGIGLPGVDRSFFELGGHSLLATRVMARVRGVLGVELPLRALFEAPTAAGLARRIEAAREAGDAREMPPIRPVARTGGLPLSFAQQRLWFLWQLDPDSPAYNIPLTLRLRGSLDVAALERTLGEIVRRHEVLRTTFPIVQGDPVQVVDPAARLDQPLADLSDLPLEEREELSRRAARAEARGPFDLSRELPVRAQLLRLGAEDHVLLVTFHHIAADAWSLSVLKREMTTLYGAFAAGRLSPLPELPVQYADFAVWQRGWLRGEVLERQLDFWRQRLADAPPALDLPLDRPRPPVASARGGKVRFALPAGLSRELVRLSQRRASTLFMTLLAGFQALLARHCGQEDVTVGTPIAGRRHLETEGLIGFFVNTLVLRGRMEGDPTFEDLLGRARETALQAYAHQDLPFERLVDELAPRRDLASTPLFQAMLVLQNVGREGVRAAGLELSSLGTDPGVAKFDLTLSLAEGEDGLAGSLEYRAELFDPATVARFGERLATLLEGAVTEPKTRLSDLPLLATAERHHLLYEWNDAAAAMAGEETLHGLVEAQVARTPDAVAVAYEGESLTYRELDRRASALARRLRAQGVGPEVRVGICAERSLKLVIGLLGILKAGGAYVPLDPGYPDARLALVAEDAGFPVLLTQAHLRERLEALAGADTRLLDLAAGAAVDPTAEEARMDGGAGPDHAAYVIFTSGSTGRPKGAVNTHRGIANRLLWMQGAYGLTTADRVIQKTPFSFDVSVWEFFWPLAIGARLVMARPGGHQDPDYLARTIAGEGITCLHFVPSMLRAFLEEPGLERCAGLRLVMASGEALPADLAASFHERLGEPCGAELHNLYGPTEAAVDVTWHACRSGEARVPIGRPVANTRIHLLDPAGGLAPVGIAGELHIGGVQVGRGYLGRPDLTAERFVPDPFGAPGSRLYRTGDLARHLPDGEVEYLGRIDHQVKVRGFRIELAEIEAVLAQHPAVHESVVTARDGGLLVAYVVPAGEEPADPAALREHLAGQLPEYMVPSAWVALDDVPRLPNGKLDRRSLPAPGRIKTPAGSALAPRTPLEEIVSGLFAEVLGIGLPGVDRSFFDLGGHSLLATRVMARVRGVLGVELPLRALFEAPTAAGLARRIEAAQEAGGAREVPPVRPLPRTGGLPLSFAQERLWFLWQLDPDSPAYNVPLALRLRGPLDAAALEQALGEIVQRHEVLRTTFPRVPGDPVQAVDPAARLGLPLADLSDLQADRREELAGRAARAEARGPFDLSRDLPVRAKLLRLDREDHVLLVTFHHIACDAWSLAVLEREVWALYEAFTAGRLSPLPELPVQYADFAVWQRGWLQGEVLERQLGFWRDQLAGAPPLLDLPLDRPRPPVASARGGKVRFVLPAGLSRELARLGQRRASTLFMTLLAGFQALLARHCGQEDIAVGTSIAGRRHLETEGLIGFFVNTLVLRGRMEGDPTFEDLLGRARETALQAYAHQDLPFERLVDELAPRRDLASTPLFQGMLVLQNVGREGRRTAGLELSSLGADPGVAKFDLTLSLAEGEDGLAGSLEYRAELFDRTTIERLLDRLQTLYEGMVSRPEQRLSEVSLLSPAERHQVLEEWGAREGGELAESCLHELFAAQAARTPEAVVLVHGTRGWTYAELAARAGGIARRLRELGAGPEARVAVCLERSPDLIASLLGVLAAGAAYVPVDPAYPADRQRFMLEDCAAAALITRGALAAGPAVLDLDAEEIPDAPLPDHPGATPEHLAYIIYTSGSTGRPKGVAIAHRSAVALADWARSQFSDEELAGVLASTSVCFDVSVFEIFIPLAWGGRLILAENALELPSLPAASEVKVATMVPSAAAELARTGAIPPSVRTVGLGGEPVPSALAARLYESGTVERVLNMYGPSEDTTYSTVALVPPHGERPPSIGRPVSGARTYVVDRHGALVPPGVPGELWMAGAGLARGYLGRPALTAERFIPDPFGPPGTRAYRTGDRVRYRPDGELEFLGRIDHQVKIRGFRVELGEIEEVLAGHPRIRECAVLVREDAPGVRFLAGYVSGGTASDAELRSWLGAKLPEYMVPMVFVRLEELPHTPNGKIDRKALPAPDREAVESYVAPAGPVEELLAGIWSEVLGLERVGTRDDFFALGGHSLLATRVVSRIRGALGVELPLRRFFTSPTVAALAAEIERERRGGALAEAPPIARAPRQGGLPLSFAQERLWFLEQLEGSTLDVIPSAARLLGDVQVEALAAALREIVRRHEALRTRFVAVAGRPAQAIAADWRPTLPLIDLSGLPAALADAELRRRTRELETLPFDLAGGPLTRFTLVKRAPGDFAFLFTLHHLISDGWSMGLLVREMAALYAAALRGEPSPLPELPLQYADFAVWQREWLRGDVLARLLGDWTKRLAGLPPLELPTDRPHTGGTRAFRAGNLTLDYPEALTAALHDLARRQGASLFMVLLAAFQGLLHRHTGQDDFAVGSPIANRNRAETEPLIGFFVNTLVLRADAGGNPTFAELIARARETTLAAYDGQDLPFIRLVEALRPDRRQGSPLIEVMLTLQNNPRQEIEIPGLRIAKLDRDLEQRFHFPLSLMFWESAGRLGGELSYNLARLDATTAMRWSGHLEALLAALAESAEQRLDELPLLSASERHQLLVEWSGDGEVIRLGDGPAPIGIWGTGERSGLRSRRRADGTIERPAAPEAGRDVEDGAARELDRQARRRERLSEPKRKLLEQRFRGQAPELGQATRAAAEPPSPLVRLQAGDPGRLPFFCVHAIGGSVLSYGELARALGPGQPFYGLQAAGLAGGPACDDLVAMAAGYAAAVEVAEPDGPYLLGGWSFGGVVAFEMARQMWERGREVPLVILFDSWAPGLMVEDSEVPGEAEVLRLFLLDQARLQGISVDALAGGPLPAGEEEEAVAWLLDRAREAGLLKAGLKPEQARAMLGVYRANLRALAAYRPEGPWDGRLLLFRPAANPYPKNGWGRLVRGPVEVREVAADHYSMLAQPAVAALAGELAAAIERNRTAVDWPRETLIHELFESRAAECPEACAVAFGDRRLSYGELATRAHRLARHLRRLGVGPEVRVGLCVERSEEMVVALLAILEAGGAYVPLDPSHPPARLELVLEDSGLRVLVSEQGLLDRLPAHPARVVCLDRDAAAIARESDRPLERMERIVEAENLAYVLYTSGSTGRPKGVGLPHRAVVNFLRAMALRPGLRDADVVPALTTLSFDIAGLEIYLPLAVGGRVEVLGREEAADGGRLAARLRETGATVLQATPATWHLLIDSGWTGTPGLRALCGGEALPRALADALLARGVELWNVYGPTETAVWSAAGRVLPGPEPVRLGDPIANTTFYVVDHELEPVPVGTPGELLIGGAGLARGYWGRPELTAERFVPHPFGSAAGEAGARVYRTGDLVRYHASGELEFLGRIDHQVKVRGFRIELGEIEAALAAHPSVRRAVVVAREEGGDKRLAGYVATGGAPAPSAAKLRDFLRQRLPDYMIPWALVALESLPLTPSGKVDRRALPAPTTEASAEEPAAPQGFIEELLAGIWEEVLGLDATGERRVGVQDDFFHLGGHSLSGTRMLSRIRQTLGVALTLQNLFSRPTLADLASTVAERLGDAAAARSWIRPVGRHGELPLSSSQLRQWFLTQLDPETDAYNLMLTLRLRGPLRIPALARALDAIVARHEVLRTTFSAVAGRPVAAVAGSLSLPLPVIDLGALPAAAREAEALRRAREERERLFDLERGPLLRAALLRLGPDEHLLSVAAHHVVFDGWSFGVFTRELAALYQEHPLPGLEIQYPDFAAWQRQWLAGEEARAQTDYWRSRLAGALQALDLPTDRPRPAVQTHRGALQEARVSAELTGRLRELGRATGSTLFMTLLAGLYALLHRYTRQEDLSAGTFVANRRWDGVEPLIGFFVNTLVLRADLSGEPGLRGLLARVRETTLGAYDHQELPFETLLEELAVERDPSRTPLVQVLLALQSFTASGVELPDLAITPAELHDEDRANFDLTLWLQEEGDALAGRLEYSTDLFERTTAQRMLGHFTGLLEAAVGQPDRPLAELPLLSDAERQQVVEEWSGAGADADGTGGLTVTGMFARQVASTPEAVAVVHGERSLTYAELDCRAAAVARRLRGLGVGPETVVGLCCPRSPEMIAGLFGILQSGAACLPLDPALPAGRLAFLVENAGAAAVVAPRSLAADFAAPVVFVDEAGGEAERSGELPGPLPGNLAYLLYTSGSTGRPKGVMVEHAALAAFTRNATRVYGIRPDDRVLQFATLSFDASCEEIYPCLTTGATLVLRDEEMMVSPARFLATCGRWGITVLDLPTAYWHLLGAESAQGRAAFPETVRVVILGGERAQPERVRAWFDHPGPRPELFNSYGPTEATVAATAGRLDERAGLAGAAVPLGAPLEGVRIWLLDPLLNPVPAGVPGEIHLAGAGLARGYHGRPDLTAERFVPSPFGEPGSRLYRTGDLARFQAGGGLEFVGRIDDQVKIRGFRVEPDEVTAVLTGHPGVLEAVVVAAESAPGDWRLIAYVVAGEPGRPTPGELRDHLKQRLPHYMMPADILPLSALPRTATGKLDRKALPRPGTGLDGGREAAPPETGTEALLIEIWRHLLGREQVGIHDNLFDLGAHSLLAPQFIARVQEIFQLDLPLHVLFEAPTVRELAVAIQDALLSQIESLSDDEAARLAKVSHPS